MWAWMGCEGWVTNQGVALAAPQLFLLLNACIGGGILRMMQSLMGWCPLPIHQTTVCLLWILLVGIVRN